MAKGATAPVEGAVLRWAREDAGLTVAEAAKRIGVTSSKVDYWEEDVEDPTINQLRAAADLYRRTMTFFFIPHVIDDLQHSTPADFRGSDHSRVEPTLIREIKKTEERRKNIIELGVTDGVLPHLEGVSILEDPAAAAARVRDLLGVSVQAQSSWANEWMALREWIHAVERLGVLVFQMSRIEIELARGLSVFHEPFPIILLNGGDLRRARVFTLMHELAHLFMRQSGVCDLWVDDQTETACNRFAACLLMPEPDVRALLPAGEPAVSSIEALAKHFAVSRSAVAVRLRELDVITQDELNVQMAIAARIARQQRDEEREKMAETDKGPPGYKTQLRNLGDNYVTTVLQALDARTITRVDASYLLEAKQPAIEKMREEMSRRGLAS